MNVFDTAVERIKLVFTEFDNVYVSFSGGKDSGVMLNLTAKVAREFFPGRRVGVFHIDYEAQYQQTTYYVDRTLESNADIFDVYRICLPVAASCATSMKQSYWIPWDADKKDLWVRELPANGITEENHEFKFFTKGMWDYDLQELFSHWLHKKTGATKTACLVGIRTQESLNRWRAIHSDKNKNKYNGLPWTLEMFNGVYNAYPVFDWTVDDVWIANARNSWDYNALYTIFWQAGVPLGKMRVASPFHACGIENLKLYKVIDPKNWAKMVGRTNGVNFAGIYGGTTAMGWKSIKLPPGHTWKSYMEFLLSTLPKDSADNYKKKLQISMEFWRNRGGCLDDTVVTKLRDSGVPMIVENSTNYKTSKLPIRMDYLDDIDIEEFREIPTYKRMCVCIMKNDHLCKYMGFGLSKTETQMRSEAMQKYKPLENMNESGL